MFTGIVSAIVIAVLVIVGLPLISNRQQRQITNGESPVLWSKLLRWGGLFVILLGVAFFFGAFQAYAQDIQSQIMPLAVTGAVCTFLGVVGMIVSHVKSH